MCSAASRGSARPATSTPARLLSLFEDLPLAIIIVDAEERIETFMPQLDELITEGLVIIDDVDVVRYVGRPKDPTGGRR